MLENKKQRPGHLDEFFKMTLEQDHLKHLLENGSVEIRAIDKTSEAAQKKKRPIIWSGVYDSYPPLRAALMQGSRMDIYSTINPTTLPAKNNPLKPYLITTKDADIEEIRTIFFDFDPVRDKGSAATDEQVQESLALAMSLTDFLDDEGWGAPTIGLSGNGAHLLYRTRLPKSGIKVLGGLYSGLQRRYSTDEVDFDASVKNPSRIARVLGTTNHKAERKSKVLLCPDDVTPANVILDTAAKLTPPKKKAHWVKPVDPNAKKVDGVIAFDKFQRAGLVLAEPDSGKFYVRCPNESQHGETGPTDTVLWFDGRFANFHCSHSHCSKLTLASAVQMI